MNRSVKTSVLKDAMKKITVVALVWTVAITTFVSLPRNSKASSSRNFDIYRKTVPNIDVNLLSQATRQITSLQQNAFEQFKSVHGNQATIRWNSFSGTPDVIMGFHTAPSSDTPENAARAFINNNAALFGVTPEALVLTEQKEGLGGYLLRFQQKAGNLDVLNGGVGIVMNKDKQIRMVMGSTFPDVNVSTTSVLNATAALARAEADIAQYAVQIPGVSENLLAPGLNQLAAEIAPILRAPRLNVFPTADGYKLAWDCITFSRNPLGLFITQVDANTGEILYRENLARAQHQQNPIPMTADIFPDTPTLKFPITGEYVMENGAPKGLTRANLRNVNAGSNVTGVNGILTGKHALIKNVLATQQPFAQSAAGTFHFRQNNAPLEAQPDEINDRSEPAEHFDVSNMYAFINYLLEYVDDIHKRDDSVHSPIGTGYFPDNYPNSDRPLVGLVHFPNAPGVLGAPIDTENEETIIASTLGLDNAFSFPATQTVDTPNGPQKIIINPTMYGHGYWFNDFAKDGPVAYHEGMHSVSTVIAGLEGVPDGSALNEGQADLWAYAITGKDSIGAYSIQSPGRQKYLDYLESNRDPNTLVWVRSARSSLKYSRMGTRGTPAAFEEHDDGEIYANTMFHLLEFMKAAEPQMQFSRPNFENGQIDRKITRGQEAWERIFLGSLYLLGTTAPDTFMKARDALIMADRIMYPTEPANLDAPGQHEALIWQVWAAHEMGVNAKAQVGGVVTISTAAPDFALQQGKPSAPQGITLSPAPANSVRVSWQPVSGAYAYEVFKRRIGKAGQRQYKGIPERPIFDGDRATSGWSYVGFATGNQNTSYDDKGFGRFFYAPGGIKNVDDATGFNEMFETEYAVRAVAVNPNKQSGFSDLSASATFSSSNQDVSSAISSAISNIRFADGMLEFDNKLTNNGISGADSTAYGPVNFKIVKISDSTVTIANADNGGNGKDLPGIFSYNQTLAAGQTSAAKRLKFNDPQARMFSFDAVITARVRGASVPANGSQPYDGDGGGQQEHIVTSQTETYNGVILYPGVELRDAVAGVGYVDVPFTAKPGSFGVTGRLTTTTPADLDFKLLDSDGNELASSGNFIDAEEVSGVIVPGRTYIYRVLGYANGPTQFTITSTQFFSDSITTGGSGASSSTGSGSSFGQPKTGVTTLKLVRFTVNPLTKAVTARIL